MAAYFVAKDFNRPQLMEQAFEPEARLVMEVRSESISFPPETLGRQAITEVLVRSFSERYDNVHSVCIGPPPAEGVRELSCAWLVVMRERESGLPRLGCGRYDWRFDSASGRTSELRIRIDCMLVLAYGALSPLLAWAATLPAPWCALPQVMDTAPARAALQPWREALALACQELGAAGMMSTSEP